MRRLLVSVACCMCAISANAISSRDTDARMDAYFAIWSNNASVTREAVDALYARQVDYYGRSMSRANVYHNKQYLIRLWPDREYRVEPGSVSKTCDAAADRCQVTAILDWKAANSVRAVGTQGATTLVLGLSRENGVLKIDRESGVPVARSTCRLGSESWRCSAFRLPALPGH